MLLNAPMPILGLPEVELYRISDPMVPFAGPEFEVMPVLGVAPILAVLGGFALRVAILGGVVIGGSFALKEFFGIATQDLVPAALLGGAAGILFFSRDLFPEGSVLRPISTITGIGTAVASLLVLFSGSAEAAVEPTPGLPQQIPPEEVPPAERLLSSKDVVIEAVPASAQPDGASWSGNLSHVFQYRVRNVSGKTLSFFSGVAVFSSSPEGPILIHDTPNKQRVLVTLAPGGTDTVDLFVPQTEEFSIRPLANFDILFGRFAAIEAQLFQSRDAATFVARTDAVTIAFGIFG